MASLSRKFRFLPTLRPFFRQHIRFKSITGNENVDKALHTVTRGQLEKWVKWYEDFVGLTVVKDSQFHVLQLEKIFKEKQIERRNQQQELRKIQTRILVVKTELEKAARGTDLYVELVTKENNIIKEEKALTDTIDVTEQQERDAFEEMSSSLRESHEKERQYNERTKYMSVTASIVGVILGTLGAALNNRYRVKELRNIVMTADKKAEEYKDMVEQLSSALKLQHSKLEDFVKNVHSKSGDTGSVKVLQKDPRTDSQLKTFSDIQRQTKEILTTVHNQEKILEQELTEIKKILVAKSPDSKRDGDVVYVGPEVKGLLDETEKNLEWKIKLNSLWTVTFIYGAIALTVPVIFSIFKGS